MGAVELEFSTHVMIKLPQFPTVRIVASCTFISQSIFVNIIVFVAIDAVRFNILKFGRKVTTFAGGNRVQSDEWKPAQVMIKLDIVSPGNFVMTSVATLILLPFVNIV